MSNMSTKATKSTMSTMLAILKIMMLNLKVAPTVRWDPTGWQGADDHLNNLQVNLPLVEREAEEARQALANA